MKKYIYNNTEYKSVYDVRNAIWENEHLIFGTLTSSEEWEKLGVTVVEIDDIIIEEQKPSIESEKNKRLSDLENEFQTYRYSNITSLFSSLGFEVNCNVTAMDNVNGLVTSLEYRKEIGEENPTVFFNDFNDTIHELTLEELKRLRYEIVDNGSYVYNQKWTLRKSIEESATIEELKNITIAFTPKSF